MAENILFEKYQGTGNDFIMLNNLSGDFDFLTSADIQKLCNRRFGVGADGLIKINASDKYDFYVDYSNSDGSKSFCGNGARCAVAFAGKLGIDVSNTTFDAIDGVHNAKMIGKSVNLAMNPVQLIQQFSDSYVLDTGSPHYVTKVSEIAKCDIVEYGRSVRYSDLFRKEGVNVNCMEIIQPKKIAVRTYERGVENETYSCGTGAVASALVYGMESGVFGEMEVEVHVKGGKLSVSFNRDGETNFTSIYLQGPAIFVFNGEIEL